jgi:integrase
MARGDPIKKIELPNGEVRYTFKVDLGRDPATGKRRQTERRFALHREAQAEFDRIRHQRREGTLVLPSKLDVDGALDVLLPALTVDVEPATAANYRDALRPVRARLGGRRLQDLTERDVDELVEWMLTAGRRRGGKPGTALGVRSVQLTISRLRAVLNEAVRRQLVARNVAAFTRIPRAARKAAAAKASERRPWSEAEVKAFLGKIKDERLFVVMLMALMGLRPAEACGLRWSDVDLDAETLTIANTRTLVDGEVIEKDPKSAKGKRVLPLPPKCEGFAGVAALLRAFKARQAREKLAAGPAYVESGYVLVDELGAPQRTDWLRRRAHELMAAAGVRKVRFYDSRHACLTYLATHGVPITIVAAWAGHADGGPLAQRTYVQPSAEHLREASRALAELFG